MGEKFGSRQRWESPPPPVVIAAGDLLELAGQSLVSARRAHEEHRSEETSAAFTMAQLTYDTAKDLERWASPRPIEGSVGPLSFWR